MRSSVAGIACRENKVFVAKRNGGGDMNGRWEFPGGKFEDGEDEFDAVKREFDEEFGLQVIPNRLIGKTYFIHNEKEYELFAVSINFSGEPKFLSAHDEYLWASADDLLTLDFADSDKAILPDVLILL